MLSRTHRLQTKLQKITMVSSSAMLAIGGARKPVSDANVTAVINASNSTARREMALVGPRSDPSTRACDHFYRARTMV
jgi:hypothetical protein